jgi:hypothetical protein
MVKKQPWEKKSMLRVKFGISEYNDNKTKGVSLFYVSKFEFYKTK